jgi:putative transposase
MQYRRVYHPGACYFFTVVTHRRYPWFNHPEAVAQLRLAIQQEKARRPFEIDAFVVMPDHLHAVWTLPENDSDYSIRWRNIKRAFTASIDESQRPIVSASRQHKSEQDIW